MMDQPKFEVYLPSPEHDRKIALWWVKMSNDDDLRKLFYVSHQSMSALFALVSPPKVCVYRTDAKGDIWFAAILDQFMNGVFLAAWCAKERRPTRETLWAFLDLWELALTHYPVVFGITKQPKILSEHERLGYRCLGLIPELWAGEDAWLLALDRPSFLKTLHRFRRMSPVLEGLVYNTPHAVDRRAPVEVSG